MLFFKKYVDIGIQYRWISQTEQRSACRPSSNHRGLLSLFVLTIHMNITKRDKRPLRSNIERYHDVHAI
jgi:hypothetical protein